MPGGGQHAAAKLPLAIAGRLAQRADVARLVRRLGERIRRRRVLREPAQGPEPRQDIGDGQAHVNELARRYPGQRGEPAWVEPHAFRDVTRLKRRRQRVRERAHHVIADQVHAAVGRDPQLERHLAGDPPEHSDPGRELRRRRELLVDDAWTAEKRDVLPAGSHATRPVIRVSQPSHHPERLDDTSDK